LTQPDLKLGADWLACAPPEVTEEFLGSLSDNALLSLPYLFEFWAMPHQTPPAGDWKTWVIMGGRGAGKTRAGAEWVRSMVEGAGPLDEGAARRVVARPRVERVAPAGRPLPAAATASGKPAGAATTS
jgi:hypothetical protein